MRNGEIAALGADHVGRSIEIDRARKSAQLALLPRCEGQVRLLHGGLSREAAIR
jgi:hypothetical protein